MPTSTAPSTPPPPSTNATGPPTMIHRGTAQILAARWAADVDGYPIGRRRATIAAVPLARRAVLGAGLAAAATALSGCGDNVRTVWAEPASSADRVEPGAGKPSPAPPTT